MQSLARDWGHSLGPQVFISYSSKDKPVADATCALLEKRGFACWFAPRDILAGTEWGEAIMNGLIACRVFVLIYSANSNESPQVRREIERAVHHGLLIIPFRIEDVPPHRAMEYFMSTPHWLDALTPPLERYLNQLADVIGRLLDDPLAAHDYAPVPPRRLENKLALAVLAGLVAVPVIAGLLAYDPPWPAGFGYVSALLVAGAAARGHFAVPSGPGLAGMRLKAAIAVLVIAGIAYLALGSMFIETIPGTSERLVKGFTCTPDAELVFADSCPNLGRDALSGAGWDAGALWTGSSLMLVRLSLALSWLVLVCGLALAAARIERLRTWGTRGKGRR